MNERCLKIMELLNESGEVDVGRLAEVLGVSGVTVRKDLAFLEGEGLLRRRHGSAVRVSPNDVGYRMTFDYDVKKRIAARAAKMVGFGEAVMIESGSTCAMLASELSNAKRDITIITNSAFIAGYVRDSGAKVILLGGAYDPDAQVMTGPLVELCASEFCVDKFFIGTDGYTPAGGFSNVDLMRAQAVRAMAANAQNKIILTDSSKFEKRGVVSLMPTSDVSAVITNAIPENCRQSLEANGVQILLV